MTSLFKKWYEWEKRMLTKMWPYRYAIGGFYTVVFGLVGAGIYINPEIMKDPVTFGTGYYRYLYEAQAYIRVGASYWWNWNNITSELHYKNARIAFNMMQKNGGFYIKAGQSINQMGDLLPDEWIEVFEPMCNMAPTSPIKAVRQVLEEDLGQPIEEVFSEFSEKPIASASLA